MAAANYSSSYSTIACWHTGHKSSVRPVNQAAQYFSFQSRNSARDGPTTKKVTLTILMAYWGAVAPVKLLGAQMINCKNIKRAPSLVWAPPPISRGFKISPWCSLHQKKYLFFFPLKNFVVRNAYSNFVWVPPSWYRDPAAIADLLFLVSALGFLLCPLTLELCFPVFLSFCLKISFCIFRASD